MRNLNELSITVWLIVGMFAIFFPISHFSSPNEHHGFSFMIPFDKTDYLICVAFGITGVISSNMRAKSVQYEEPAKLTVLNYFQSIIQLLLDVLFLNTPFTGQQVFGMIIIFAANSVKWYSSVKKAFFNFNI
jgi:drug/metabolite transporter (DMT)-like permease